MQTKTKTQEIPWGRPPFSDLQHQELVGLRRAAYETSRSTGPVPAEGDDGAKGTPPRNTRARRLPFQGEHFFAVPLALYDTGLARSMKSSQFIRYVTLLRASNYNYTDPIRISLKDLKEMDGVSVRAARDAHIKLQEYGLILIRKSKPFTYTLVSPPNWKEVGRLKPKFVQGRTLRVANEWST